MFSVSSTDYIPELVPAKVQHIAHKDEEDHCGYFDPELISRLKHLSILLFMSSDIDLRVSVNDGDLQPFAFVYFNAVMFWECIAEHITLFEGVVGDEVYLVNIVSICHSN